MIATANVRTCMSTVYGNHVFTNKGNRVNADKGMGVNLYDIYKSMLFIYNRLILF